MLAKELFSSPEAMVKELFPDFSFVDTKDGWTLVKNSSKWMLIDPDCSEFDRHYVEKPLGHRWIGAYVFDSEHILLEIKDWANLKSLGYKPF